MELDNENISNSSNNNTFNNNSQIEMKSGNSFNSITGEFIDLSLKFKEYLQEDTEFFNSNNKIEEKDFENNIDNYNISSAYLQTLCFFIEQSTQTTFQGLNIAIKKANDSIFKKIYEDKLLKNNNILTLRAVSEITLNIISKHISKKLSDDFTVIKNNIVSLLKDLHVMSDYAKQKISNFFKWYIKNGINLLIHGYNTTLINALIESKKSGVNFKVFITESNPENNGYKIEKILKSNNIECEIILDISIGYHMKDIDCVIVGADAVCENGGIINKIGTFTCALCCKNFKKPFYVMVESLKFLKLYPLDQYDIPEIEGNKLLCDYTPPEFINLLFTDIGIFTPSAVSDELIQMYYN